MIYLIGREKFWHQNPFKIGFSVNPMSRLLGIQTGNPYRLRVVKTWEGGMGEEREIHAILQDFRSTGGSEWFDPIMLPRHVDIQDIVKRSRSISGLADRLKASFRASEPGISDTPGIQISLDFDYAPPPSTITPIEPDISHAPAIQTSLKLDQPPSPFSMTPTDREWILHTYAHNGLIPKR